MTDKESEQDYQEWLNLRSAAQSVGISVEDYVRMVHGSAMLRALKLFANGKSIQMIAKYVRDREQLPTLKPRGMRRFWKRRYETLYKSAVESNEKLKRKNVIEKCDDQEIFEESQTRSVTSELNKITAIP